MKKYRIVKYREYFYVEYQKIFLGIFKSLWDDVRPLKAHTSIERAREAMQLEILGTNPNSLRIIEYHDKDRYRIVMLGQKFFIEEGERFLFCLDYFNVQPIECYNTIEEARDKLPCRVNRIEVIEYS